MNGVLTMSLSTSGSLSKHNAVMYVLMRANAPPTTTAIPVHPITALNNQSLRPTFAVTGPTNGPFACTVSVLDGVS